MSSSLDTVSLQRKEENFLFGLSLYVPSIKFSLMSGRFTEITVNEKGTLIIGKASKRFMHYWILPSGLVQ